MLSRYDRVQAGETGGTTGDRGGPEHEERPTSEARTGGRDVEVVGGAPPVPDPAVVAAVRALEAQLRETHRALDAFVDRLDPPTD